MALVEDYAAFLDIDEFAEFVTIRNVDVRGIFDLSYVNPFDLGAVPKPAFVCASADVDGIVVGQALTRQVGGSRVNDTAYVVTEIAPDGYGMVTLSLRAA